MRACFFFPPANTGIMNGTSPNAVVFNTFYLALMGLVAVVFGSNSLQANVFNQSSPITSATNLMQMMNEGVLGRVGVLPPAAEVIRDRDQYVQQLQEDLRQGRLNRIKPIAELLLKSKPNDGEVHGLLGLYLAITSQYDQALEHARKARLVPAGAFLAQLAESIIQRSRGDTNGAIRLGRQATTMEARHPYAWNVLGRAYLNAGQYTNALNSFNRAVELNTSFFPAHLNLGALYFLLQDFPKSAQAYMRAMQLSPGDADARFGLALAYDALGDLGNAVEQLKEALRIQPDNTRSLVKLTEIQVRQGKWNEAITNAQQMLSRQLPGADLMLADAYLQKGDYPAALQHLAKVPSNNPDRLYLSGYHLMAISRLAEALTEMEKVLQSNPDHSGAWLAGCALRMGLGERSDLAGDYPSRWPNSLKPLFHFLQGCFFATRKDWPMALRSFQASEGFFPGFSVTGVDGPALAKSLPPDQVAHLAIGMLLHLKNLHGPALSAFDRLLQANHRSFLAHYLAGAVQLKLGNRKQSMVHFEQSVQEAPNFFAGLFAAGELAFTSGRPAEAAIYYRRAQKVKDDVGLSLRLGLFYENTGDLTQAEREYRKVIQLAPEFFAGYNQLAWFLASRGQKLDEALRLAEQADKLLPDNGSILDTLGWIYHLKRQPVRALQYLQRAVEANPSNPTLWYHLGVAQHSQGETEKARQSLEKAFAISDQFPNYDEAKKLREKLK